MLGYFVIYLWHRVTSVSGVSNNVFIYDLENDESNNTDKVCLEGGPFLALFLVIDNILHYGEVLGTA